ncbi:Regulator of chromosome condensation (RCC1) family with FYVE zinc finger domain [Raphanus sativus]|nr:Regulator of chromosome condensation (RCC1) family with FYVE zinc finger domain [Raphanus sativus]
MALPNGVLTLEPKGESDVGFGSSKKFFSASVPGSRIVSRVTSPISRRLSPPARSTTPTPTLSGLTTPKIVVDDTKRTNDNISQEVVMLRSQVSCFALFSSGFLFHNSSRHAFLLKILHGNSERCKAAKDVIKSLTAQLKDMAERLHVGSSRTIKPPSLNSVGSCPEHIVPSSNTFNRPNSRETDTDGPSTVPMFCNETSTPVFDDASYRQQANHAAESINRTSTRAKESDPPVMKMSGLNKMSPVCTSLSQPYREGQGISNASVSAESGLVRSKQKSGGQRTEDEFTNNTMYG